MILETKRLYLRELTTEDAIYLYELNLDPEVIKYTGDDSFVSVEEAFKFLQHYDQYQKYHAGRWAVIQKFDAAFLGWCGLKYNTELDEVDIGFRFFKKFWNKGFASEAALACLDYGFDTLHLKKIIGKAQKENEASIRVLQKIGMHFVSTIDFEGKEGVLYEI